jgi:hypothetical protein
MVAAELGGRWKVMPLQGRGLKITLKSFFSLVPSECHPVKGVDISGMRLAPCFGHWVKHNF